MLPGRLCGDARIAADYRGLRPIWAPGGGWSHTSGAYLREFVPGDPAANLLGDVGDATATTGSYSFNVPAGALFPVVFSMRNPGVSCADFDYRADSRGPWAKDRPEIDGEASVGSVLSGTDGEWSQEPVPTIGRRWMRCDDAGGACTAIPGATSLTYTVTNADLGHTLRLRNDATDPQATNFSDSEFVEPFIPFEEHEDESIATGDRALQGIFVRGPIETRCKVPNAPPTILQPNTLFLYDSFPVTSLLNEPVCLVVRAVPACGAGVTPMIFNPAFDPAAGIAVNYAGNSSNGPSEVGVVSATLSSGGQQDVVVSRNHQGSLCPSYGVKLGANAPFATVRPSIAGDAVEGGALGSTTGTWSGTPSFTRVWLHCDAAGAACAPIPGATGASYTPTAADVDRRLRVRVTATQGRSVSSDSAATGVVAALPAGGGGTTAPLDRTGPTGTLRLGSRNLARAVKTGRIPVAVSCDESCSVAVQVRVTRKLARKLRLRGKTILASGRNGDVAAGSETTIRAKLNRRARRALRRRRSVNVHLVATFTDQSGNRSTKGRGGSLKRPRR